MIKLKFVRPKLPAPNNAYIFSLVDAERLVRETNEVMAIIMESVDKRRRII